MAHSKVLILSFIFVSVIAAGQQTPISENYFLDKYSLSSSYAGQNNPGTIVMGFRSDWTGISGGPKTFSVAFSDNLTSNAGFGGRLVYDRAGIFDQLYLMATYSYSLVISGEQRILFGLSAGLYRNGINFTEHYNDPAYNIDPVMTQQDIRSRVKIMSDYSVVYLFKGFDAGVMFSNITFGDTKFSELEVTYKPFAIYQAHAGYSVKFNDKWRLEPFIILRGGKFIKRQAGIASRIVYRDIFWVSFGYRDLGIWGTGIGAVVNKGFMFSYNFNMASSAGMNIFNCHELTIAINIREILRKGADLSVSAVPDEKLY